MNQQVGDKENKITRRTFIRYSAAATGAAAAGLYGITMKTDALLAQNVEAGGDDGTMSYPYS